MRKAIVNLVSVEDVTSESILDSRDLADLLRTLDEDSEDEEERELFAALEELRDQVGSEWKHGVTLIQDSYFEDYAREMADGIYGVEKGPLADYIDWERWAADVQADYSSVEMGGTTFWYR